MLRWVTGHQGAFFERQGFTNCCFYSHPIMPLEAPKADLPSAPAARVLPARVRKPSRNKVASSEDDIMAGTEQYEYRQALKNSVVINRMDDVEPAEAPTYHPSVEEFADPIAYIASIRIKGTKGMRATRSKQCNDHMHPEPQACRHSLHPHTLPRSTLCYSQPT